MSPDLKNSIDQLLKQIATLQENDQYLQAESLQERVSLAYRQKTLEELRRQLEGNSELLIPGLKDFLAKNWKIINGTVLSYTALPNDELTLLLCGIAELVAF